MTDVVVHSTALMGTVVTIQVVGGDPNAADPDDRAERIAQAIEWFRHVEAACTRFNPDSEVMQLLAQVGTPVHVSALLYEVVHYALAVAESSDGAFDPTIGHRLATRGFNVDFRTGRAVQPVLGDMDGVTWRDVVLDDDAQTIMIARPLILDLGAVAKGLAVDLAARAFHPHTDFAIDAGGDLYLSGRNVEEQPWSVGIRHPRDSHELIETLRVTGMAVCTSGDYERRTGDGAEHHIMDARTGMSASRLASVTVVAPSAMVADALGTAAFALGPADGLAFLEQHGVEGLLVTPELERLATDGMTRYLARDVAAGRSLS